MRAFDLIKKGFKFLTDDDYRFLICAAKGRYDNLSDEEFLKRKFKAIMKKDLDIENPKTFNEKLQWLKLHNQKPEMTMMSDKYLVREYIASVLGEEYLIPLIGVWDNPDEIDFSALPARFAMKCNHNSGVGMCICKDKSKLDWNKVKKDLEIGLQQDYYLTGREWPYKDIPRKIIAEQFIEDETGGLVDYKFFCFDGYVDCVMVCLDRHLGDTKFYFFDETWSLKRLNVRGKNAPEGFTIRKPECIDKMFDIAKKLSKGHPFVRVDLYECSEKIYFGELTFYPNSGFGPNYLPEADEYLGSLINLPR